MQSENDQGYKSNYRKMFATVIFDHTANTLASSALIVGYALFLGLNEFFIGIFLSLRVILGMTAVFSAPLFTRIGQSKFAVLPCQFLYRFSAYAIIFIPFMTDNVVARSVIFCVCMSISIILSALQYAPMVNWRMQLLKQDDQKKFFAHKNIVVLLISTIITLTLGQLVDTYKETAFAYGMFAICLSVIMALGLLEFTLRAWTYKPPVTETNKVTIASTIAVPLKNPDTRRVILFCAFVSFFISLGSLYFTLYQIKYLGMSYFYIAVLICVSTVAGIIGGLVFGKIAVVRKNYKFVLLCGLLLMIGMFATYAVMGQFVLYIAPITSFMWGFGATGFDLYESIAIHENAPKEYAVTTLSCFKFVSGCLSLLLVAVTFIFLNGDNGYAIRTLFGASAIGLGFCCLFLALWKKV